MNRSGYGALCRCRERKLHQKGMTMNNTASKMIQAMDKNDAEFVVDGCVVRMTEGFYLRFMSDNCGCASKVQTSAADKFWQLWYAFGNRRGSDTYLDFRFDVQENAEKAGVLLSVI